MITCPGCGHGNEDDSVTCQACGRSLRPPREITLRNPPAPTRRAPPPPPPPRWRHALATDPMEQAFLVTLRAKPDDAATRSVYADWLEEQGDPQRAAFVRHEGRIEDRRQVLGTGDAEWRAITSRSSLECERADCQARWDTLDADPTDEQVRRCQTCTLPVRYCATREAIEATAWSSEPYVVDAAMDPEEAQRWHDQASLAEARSRTW